MFNWLKELLDREYRPIEKWKLEAKIKRQRLALIWNSYEKRTYPLIVPNHADLLECISTRISGKQEHFTDYFDYREKKVVSFSSVEKKPI